MGVNIQYIPVPWMVLACMRFSEISMLDELSGAGPRPSNGLHLVFNLGSGKPGPPHDWTEPYID